MQEEHNKQKSGQALREEAILQFWKDQDIFQKTVKKESPKGEFVFYEGPPTANAKPALHHLEARAFKDVIPRYKTMQGFSVRRKAGWDTHGLPVELQIEKKLGLSSKKEIEQYGIAKFNRECRESVFTYIRDWESFTDRIGYWVNKEDAYYTFDSRYIESLWNIVAKVNDQGLLYKDYKVVPWCPRCGTALSSHELAQGYQDVKDLSVYVKFRIKNNHTITYDQINDPITVGILNTSDKKVFMLAWTTTPWTLPGNVGLAINSFIRYSLFQTEENEIYIVAENRESIFENSNLKKIGSTEGVIFAMKNENLEYEPLYPFLKETIQDKTKLENAYKVYEAGFVTTTDGTGIVHTAVMYGQDDFELGTKVGLPKIHTVDETGHFIKGTDFLEGKFVKDEETAVAIIKDLAHRGLLFKKEKYEHSYPHCWRCKTPLIYYARDSWYIAMSKLRDTLVKENEGINWEPAHIKEGRFGEWLREIKDWAISRERYWGTPLPIWIAEDGEKLVVDSVETLKKYSKPAKNHYFVMRHAEAVHNLTRVVSLDANADDSLTETGKEQARVAAEALQNKNIDLIISSPFLRAKQTADIVAKVIGAEIVTDNRLGEMMVHSYAGKTWDDYHADFPKTPENFSKGNDGDETYLSVKCRMFEALQSYEKAHEGKNILFITHGAPGWLLLAASQGLTPEAALAMVRTKEDYHQFKNAEVQELQYMQLPLNDSCELDLHRPFIDEVTLTKDGKAFKRVKEVMDVWFDSGAMPFAQDHYPFENKERIDSSGYPADFISEAIDQTRGWFYTLHAVGVLMGRGKAYRNVICLGHLLDAQGKKMSKSVGNIVEPWNEIHSYGADVLRFWMYYVNQPGDSKNYDPKTVDEVVKKVFNLVYNILSFYELYRDKELEKETVASSHVLDQWIMARLQQLTALSTEALDAYKLLEPARAIRDFIDDLSTWYLRRSRDRLKEGSIEAKQTLYSVLKTLATLMAPFTPFAAEDIWQKLKTEQDAESVHLAAWPAAEDVDAEMLENMQIVRDICTEGNALRKKENIPVRQPLAKLEVQQLKLEQEYKELIKEELNVKEVVLGEETKLDIAITPELKAEGEYRELVRSIQDLRKEKGLLPKDTMTLLLPSSYKEFGAGFLEKLKKTVGAKEIIFTEDKEIEIK